MNEWNLKALFKSDGDSVMEEKRKLAEQKSYEFVNKWKERQDYLEDPAILKQALDEYEEWERFYGPRNDEWYYFWLRNAQDQNDHVIKARLNKADDFTKKIYNDIHFFILRISKIPKENQKKF